MKCDIIVPTYQAAEVLLKTLQALAEQEIPAGWEIRLIISDDGSTDNTVHVAQQANLPSSWKRVVLTSSHTGSAGARNRALNQAEADIIFFLGADILLRPGAVAHHLLFHEHHPDSRDAALGMVHWDPRLKPSPLMEWMEHGGQQNDFDSLLGKLQADPRTAWYCSHLSVKQEFVQALRFSEQFTSYGWEDLAMGHEATTRGACLHVLHQAVGLHHHIYSPHAIANRQQAVGLNITRFQAEHPTRSLLPKRSLLNHLRRGVFMACGGQILLLWGIVFWGSSHSLPRAFLLFTANEFWKGVWRSHRGFFAYLREYNRNTHLKP